MTPSRSDALAALLATTLQSRLPRHERAALVRFLEQHLARARELDDGDARFRAGFKETYGETTDTT